MASLSLTPRGHLLFTAEDDALSGPQKRVMTPFEKRPCSSSTSESIAPEQALQIGVGARLDRQPELLFTLRKVDQQDLIATAGSEFSTEGKRPAGTKALASDDLSEMFGIEMAPPTPTKRPAAGAVPRKPSPAATVAGSSKRKEPTPPAKSTKIAPTRKPGDEERRLTQKKRRAIAKRMRRYWAERRAGARRRKTSESL